MADIAGGRTGARHRFAVDDEPSAQPGAVVDERHVRAVVAAASRATADPAFRDGGSDDVLVEQDRHAGRRLQDAAQRQVPPLRQVGRFEDHAGSYVDGSRGGHAQSQNSASVHAGVVHEPPDAIGDGADHPLRTTGGCGQRGVGDDRSLEVEEDEREDGRVDVHADRVPTTRTQGQQSTRLAGADVDSVGLANESFRDQPSGHGADGLSRQSGALGELYPTHATGSADRVEDDRLVVAADGGQVASARGGHGHRPRGWVVVRQHGESGGTGAGLGAV